MSGPSFLCRLHKWHYSRQKWANQNQPTGAVRTWDWGNDQTDLCDWLQKWSVPPKTVNRVHSLLSSTAHGPMSVISDPGNNLSLSQEASTPLSKTFDLIWFFIFIFNIQYLEWVIKNLFEPRMFLWEILGGVSEVIELLSIFYSKLKE